MICAPYDHIRYVLPRLPLNRQGLGCEARQLLAAANWILRQPPAGRSVSVIMESGWRRARERARRY